MTPPTTMSVTTSTVTPYSTHLLSSVSQPLFSPLLHPQTSLIWSWCLNTWVMTVEHLSCPRISHSALPTLPWCSHTSGSCTEKMPRHILSYSGLSSALTISQQTLDPILIMLLSWCGFRLMGHQAAHFSRIIILFPSILWDIRSAFSIGPLVFAWHVGCTWRTLTSSLIFWTLRHATLSLAWKDI